MYHACLLSIVDVTDVENNDEDDDAWLSILFIYPIINFVYFML